MSQSGRLESKSISGANPNKGKAKRARLIRFITVTSQLQRFNCIAALRHRARWDPLGSDHYLEKRFLDRWEGIKIKPRKSKLTAVRKCKVSNNLPRGAAKTAPGKFKNPNV